MRVGIIAFLQESNTFLHEQTTLEHYRQELLVTGEAVRERLASSHHEVAGFFAGLADHQLEAVPLFAARAIPFGTMTAETFNTLTELLFAEVEKAGPLDGYLLAPHGATVSEAVPDVDGAWLTRLREMVGPHVPMIATLDPHANLSAEMVAATDAIIAYRTNPHMDQQQRGREAADLIAGTLLGEVRPTQAAAFPPMAINIEKQHTTEDPCHSFLAQLHQQTNHADILSASLVLGFPYADVAEMGSSIIVVTNNDADLAQQTADDLAANLWEQRHAFAGTFRTVSEVIDDLPSLPAPICLLDMGDNVGGGSPGDGTILAQALLDADFGPAFVCLYHPSVSETAFAFGVGQTVQLEVGGQTDSLHGPPLVGEFHIQSLHDGTFTESKPRHGGYTAFDQGPTAILTRQQLTVMVTSKRMAPFSLNQLISCDLDPARFRVLIAKGVNAPVAAYEEVCQTFLRVNTPGVTTADMTQLHFNNRRQPMFPFEPDTEWPREIRQN